MVDINEILNINHLNVIYMFNDDFNRDMESLILMHSNNWAINIDMG